MKNGSIIGGVRSGNGEVVITELVGGGAPAVPEPSTWAMMATGLAGLAALRFRRRRA